MNRVVRFFRDSILIPIGIGILIFILFVMNQKKLVIWLSHIWVVCYFMPISYDLTGSFNSAFCCNAVLKCTEGKGFRKKVILSSFWKKLFYGYDNCGNMLWLILIYQSIMLIYICVFMLLNLIFMITLVIKNVVPTMWIKLWFFEVILQCVIFAIIMISSYLKDIYLWSKERKMNNDSQPQRKQFFMSVTAMLKAKKIIRQKSLITLFLKQYGLYTSKHGYYMISISNLKQAEKALLKEFPELHIISSENENGNHIFKVYNKKEDYLLIQMYEKN